MAKTSYHDLELYFQGPPQAEVYRVTAWARQQDLRAHSPFRLPFSLQEITRAIRWMEQGLFDEPYVVEFGSALFRALFQDELRRLYDALEPASARLRLRFVVDPSAAALALVPWELLYDPQRIMTLAAAHPLVRGLALTEPTRPLQVNPPLSLLLVDSFPFGVLRVQDQIEAAGIQHALNGLVRRRRMIVRTLTNTTLRALQDTLRDAANPERPQPIHILHFIGHGQHDPVTGQTVLLFRDEQGEIDPVTPENLINIVRRYDLKLVFLNACQSLQASALDLTQGFAPGLLRAGVPAVIGMQATVLDELAIQFAQNFYGALADNAPVDVAVTDARQLARGATLRRKADLGIPVCYLRSETGQIMELQPDASSPLTRATWRPWLQERATPRRVIGLALGALTLFATFLGLYWGLVPFFQPPPPFEKIGGELAIAVAPITEVDRDGNLLDSTDGDDLADKIAGSLQLDINQVKGDFDLRVGGTTEQKIRELKGATLQERQNDARQLANDYGAQVVIYGDLVLSEGETEFHPFLYITETYLRDAEELSGYHSFDEIPVGDDIRTNPQARQRLRESFLTQIPALVEFMLGLGNFALGDFKGAGTYFENATAKIESNSASPEIAKVYYLFAGKTAHDLGDWSAAQSHYQKALDKNKDFARAQLGYADTVFQQAKDDCQPGQVDVDGLNKALEGYQGALAAQDQIPDANISVKTAFYLGRLYMCMSLAEVGDYWEQAATETEIVTRRFEEAGAEEKIYTASRASDAYANLAFIRQYGPEQDLNAAAINFERALQANLGETEKGRRQNRQAFLHRLLAQVYEELLRYDEADREWDRAIRLDESNAQITRTPSPFRNLRDNYLQKRSSPPLPPHTPTP